MLGGASESVPTVSVPGTPRPSALTLTAVNGATVAVVYLSAPGPWAAAARLVGSALALSTPGGAHWSTFAPAGARQTHAARSAARPTPATKTFMSRIQSNVMGTADRGTGFGSIRTQSAPDGRKTPRRTSSPSMILAITSDRSAQAARAPSGSLPADRGGLGLVERQDLVVVVEVGQPERARDECLRRADRGLQPRAGVFVVDDVAELPRRLLKRARLFAAAHRRRSTRRAGRGSAEGHRRRRGPTRCRSAARRARGVPARRTRRIARRTRRGGTASTGCRHARAGPQPPGSARG